MNTKYKLLGAGLLLLAVALGCYKLLHKDSLGSASPAGTTNSTPKMNQIVCANTSTTTYASFLNGDANDRVVTSLSLYIQLATTTGTDMSAFNNIGAGTSSNAVATSTSGLFWSGSVSTTSANIYIPASIAATTASSTAGGNPYVITSDANRVWASGSYLNFKANATSSGYCTAAVHYLAE